jgi:hypothetical protein
MFLISGHVKVYKVLVCVRFFSSTSLMLGHALGSDHPPNPGAHPPLEGCPMRRALPYISSLSIQVAWQTFATVSTWAAEMSLNCLFLGQPTFNLLPLPIEETIRLGCFFFVETNGKIHCKDNQACFRVDYSTSWAGSTLTVILLGIQLPSGWPCS